MPIEAPTLTGAVTQLKDHLNGLLARTITETPLIAFALRGDDHAGQMQLGFRQKARPSFASLGSKYGTLYLSLQQLCVSDVVDGMHRLETKLYKYALRADPSAKPIIRWEYIREPSEDDFTYCRHHVQGEIKLPPPLDGVTMNQVHVPTGYTLVEEVIRFCIADLGVPPLHDDWDALLKASERKFKDEFAT